MVRRPSQLCRQDALRVFQRPPSPRRPSRLRWAEVPRTPLHLVLLLASLLPANAQSNTVALKSFGYQSLLVPCDGKDHLLPFDTKHNWKMAPGFAVPGAGKFPEGNFYLRRVAISHAIQGDTGGLSYAVVGHFG